MMLLPYSSDPLTGSLIPSMSTPGRKIKDKRNAVDEIDIVGNIANPKYPTYNLLLVDVTLSKKLPQELFECIKLI